jgi:hypothetical protein
LGQLRLAAGAFTAGTFGEKFGITGEADMSSAGEQLMTLLHFRTDSSGTYTFEQAARAVTRTERFPGMARERGNALSITGSLPVTGFLL